MAVMPDDPGPFHKLVGTEQEIHPENGELKHEGGQKTKRHRINPHVDHVADQAEAAVAAGAEYARDQRRVDGGPPL